MKNPELIASLSQLLKEGQIHSHQQLCGILKERGFAVTQSTISRLLRKLGAVKGTNAKQEIVYLLPRETVTSLAVPTDLSKLVFSITHNEQLIIINTAPGSANIVASLLDINRNSCHILGTIAGDDTILVVPITIQVLTDSVKAISKLLA